MRGKRARKLRKLALSLTGSPVGDGRKTGADGLARVERRRLMRRRFYVRDSRTGAIKIAPPNSRIEYKILKRSKVLAV